MMKQYVLFNVVLATVPDTNREFRQCGNADFWWSILSPNSKWSTGLGRCNNMYITFYFVFRHSPGLVRNSLLDLSSTESITAVSFPSFSFHFWNCAAFSRKHLSHWVHLSTSDLCCFWCDRSQGPREDLIYEKRSICHLCRTKSKW